MKPIELISRDAIKLFDDYLSIELWEKQKAGENIFDSLYSPDERIAHYKARMERYGSYVAGHVKNGTPLKDIIDFIEKAFSYLPEPLKIAINKFITDLINKLLGEIF